MDNLIQLAMQILFCLLIAAILGAIIGYLLGKMSKCDKDDYDGKELNNYDSNNEYDNRETAKLTDNKYDDTIDSVNNRFGDAKDSVSDSFGDAKDSVSDAFGDAKDSVSDSFSSAKDSVGNKLGDAKDSIGGAFDKVTDGASGSLDALRSKASSAVSGTTATVTAAGVAATGAVASVVSDNNVQVGQEVGNRPYVLNNPDNSEIDDLKEISGVGLKIEEALNNLGVYKFEQIANWSNENIEWIENYLVFQGRIKKEDWIGQAKLLFAGGETEFSKKIQNGKGLNY